MKKNILVSTILLSISMGCAENKEASDSSELNGYVASENFQWEDPMNIPFCWNDEKVKTEPPKGSAHVNDKNKKLLIDNANKAYASAGIRFVGLEACTDDFEGIRFQLRPGNRTGGSVSGIGNQLKKVRNSDGHNAYVVIGNVEDYFITEEDKKRKEGDLYHYQYVIFNHEIGHTVGLFHEMNRRDDEFCNFQDQTEGHGQMKAGEGLDSGGVSIGMPDKHSIMSYCYREQRIDDSKGALSEGDIATIKELYKKGSDNNPVIALFGVTFEPSLGEGDRLNLKLTSKNKYYRYKLSKQENTSSDVCADEKDYSDPISSSVSVDKLLTKENGFEYGNHYRICIVGGDSDHTDESSVWQSFKEASQEVFIFESHVAHVKGEYAPGLFAKTIKDGQKKVLFDITSSNPKTKYYKYKIGRVDHELQFPCGKMRGTWSSPVSIDKAIDVDTKILGKRDYILFNICVLGGGSEQEGVENWQSEDGASRLSVLFEVQK